MHKEYFIKNPDGFLFTHLFSSGSMQDKLASLSGVNAELLPISMKVVPFEEVGKMGKAIVIVSTFPTNLAGKSLTVFPQKEVKKIAKKAKLNYTEYLQKLYEPLALNTGMVFKNLSGSPVNAIKYADLHTYPTKENIFILQVKYNLMTETGNVLINQFITPEFLKSVYEYFTDGKVTENGFSTSESVLDLFKELNKEFQKDLIQEIAASEEYRVAVQASKGDSSAAEKLNLEELRLVPDLTIRILLDELMRRSFSNISLVRAISGMSDDLREKLLSNMSRNRKSEIRDLLRNVNCGEEDVLQAQKNLAWVIVDLAESNKITISKRFSKQLKHIIESIERILFDNAEKYIKSNVFGIFVNELNDVILQVLLRKVKRSILISALSALPDSSSQKVKGNMTEHSWNMLREDIAYWEKTKEDEKNKVIESASAQQEMSTIAQNVKKQFKMVAF